MAPVTWWRSTTATRNRAASPPPSWAPGQLIYDYHPIALGAALPAGAYQLVLRVYNAGDGSILLTTSGEDHYPVGLVQLQPAEGE
ncbi:MAG: hypothetical protein HC915_14965 [Anaerolineae bacterium]|nr:hypothetical protein [Anaerolineae bacterium]